MGRCPVRSIFPEALKLFSGEERTTWLSLFFKYPVIHMLECASFMFAKIMPLAEAVEGYDIFNQMKVQKVVFQL
jgi:hypothetical protein